MENLGNVLHAGKSGLFRGEDFASVERDDIKKAVKNREIRLVIATDAACEGLNLQTLGTLINVDLPWNPSRLEQRSLGTLFAGTITPRCSQSISTIEHYSNLNLTNSARDSKADSLLPDTTRSHHPPHST